ncbi:hypothetical protein ABIG06_004726 [Bradyrhizobium sp. USDA 326]|uniref:hypothetical protein n=1 Tax=unclassified Bradyrhizobium TaxID=2631580 RepID=UPI000F536E42|nr:hypothetical protein [Bradyrhizobium sp. RP6]RQH09398.1 hypothetical protein EHH60_25035 [Bradyrhizobium sp. RP6]
MRDDDDELARALAQDLSERATINVLRDDAAELVELLAESAPLPPFGSASAMTTYRRLMSEHQRCCRLQARLRALLG